MNYRLKIIEELGGHCMYVDSETGLGCSMRWDGQPIDNVDMLHVEHVNGGGGKQRRNIKGTNGGIRLAGNSKIVPQIKRSPDEYYIYILEHLNSGDYQLLCANHHALKTAMERRARKQAQTIVKGEPSVPDVYYEQDNKNNIITESFGRLGYVNYDATLDRFQGTVYISPNRQLTSPLPNYFTLACDNEK